MDVTAIKIEPEIITEIKIENDSLHIEQPPDMFAFDVKQEFKEYQDSNSECYDNDHLSLNYNIHNCEVKLEGSSDFDNELQIGCAGQVGNDNIEMITPKFNEDEEIDISDGIIEDVKYNIGQAKSLNNRDKPRLQYHCHVCNFTTVRKASLTKHLLLHSREIRCEFCGKSFTHKPYLDAHLLSKHKNTLIALKMDLPFETYNCNQCKYETAILGNFNRHKITHERRLNRSRPKNVCSDKYEYKTEHESHLKEQVFSPFDTDDFPTDPPAPSAIPVDHVEMSDRSPTPTLLTNATLIDRTHLSDSREYTLDIKEETDDIFDEFEPLRTYDQDSLLDMESHINGGLDHSMDSHEEGEGTGMMHEMAGADFSGIMRPEISNSDPNAQSNGHSDLQSAKRGQSGCPKTWTQGNMDLALDALRSRTMGLKQASLTYGIPSTTLWHKAHRMGIDTPKKRSRSRSWTKETVNNALETLKTGTISADKASGACGIPSRTLHKKARREGIILAAPDNPSIPTWTDDDLENALESIRTGRMSVQQASTEFGVPTGTLYGRCKKDGIELPRWGAIAWSMDDMEKAIEAVGLGHMSVNQASIHYNLPYSSLYVRVKRGTKDDSDDTDADAVAFRKIAYEESLNNALDALRNGTLSANKASRVYGIPSHTLYKKAKREGITLATPFHAVPVTWKAEDMEKALESLRTGRLSVQKASTEFGIPRRTLYVKCKKEGVELRPALWSQDAMGNALEAIGLGRMSVGQAAVHYNLPYSSLYGRFRRRRSKPR